MNPMLLRAPKPADRDHVVGGDVGAAVNLPGIDVNVLGVAGIAFNRAFTVVVVKLFDEVLLTEEVSNLRSEADLRSGTGTAVNCFHANAVVARRNRYHVVAVEELQSADGRNKEQAAVQQD